MCHWEIIFWSWHLYILISLILFCYILKSNKNHSFTSTFSRHYIYICVCIHIHMHIYTYTYTYGYIWPMHKYVPLHMHVVKLPTSSFRTGSLFPHYWEYCLQKALSIQLSLEITSAEDAFLLKWNHLSRAGHIQWLSHISI